MPRQSISLTRPNDEWLKAQVISEEYTSKSDAVNDIIRKAREIEYIRAKLIRAEQSMISELSADEIRAQSKEELRSSMEGEGLNSFGVV
ncbi:MAG TPA: CopG family transcriptional regulator [Gammaproteobacteria bacterium]|nr:CopG family transcriptional regulator [Gammaproteobacteria bacterium]|tara:strand:+ start:5453 stop:5719 length:267 start_codon:yes stop_codon:yes gene_type:complete